MSNKIWIYISLGAFLLGGLISYKLFYKPPTTISSWKNTIKKGNIAVAKGKIDIKPTGEVVVSGEGINFDFTDWQWELFKKSTVSNKPCYLWLTVNPFDIHEFGVGYSTPFLFNTSLRVDVAQIDFKVFRVMVGIGVPL